MQARLHPGLLRNCGSVTISGDEERRSPGRPILHFAAFAIGDRIRRRRKKGVADGSVARIISERSKPMSGSNPGFVSPL